VPCITRLGLSKCVWMENFRWAPSAIYWSVGKALGSHLNESMEETITWRFMANWKYLTSSTHMGQFVGTTLTNMNRIVWKIWALPKIKCFSWLAFKTALDIRSVSKKRMAKGVCALCKRVPKSVVHFLHELPLHVLPLGLHQGLDWTSFTWYSKMGIGQHSPSNLCGIRCRMILPPIVRWWLCSLSQSLGRCGSVT
jgi:hypothetical protein